ncbi:DNA-processing protein DprA [Alicyclobacillus sp. SO9]|uniref:DNA-processing protein DprA n=1 Tax=Alicyclobacillus sp. SO9 TaxID=2665646 RepID=UPI0018E74E67|nr:DNA-processing protein DprA [Alicyclobacillus sp. SO9]QQE80793.1 DNA-protecting protein DprA [Alicyclobacillus sp. SO9]
MTEGERTAAIALAMCNGLERRSLNKVVTGLHSAVRAWKADPAEWLVHCSLHQHTIEKLDRWRTKQNPSALVKKLSNQGIGAVVRGEELYPERLLQWGENAPLVLFVKGNRELLMRLPAVSVVGTRRASAYGLEAARWLANSLAGAGVTVVSGLALGIDAAAHRAALRASGPTIAVLGSGVNVCYPPSHRDLFQQIQESGLLVSEYPPDDPVAKHHFPERNRIIAALGEIVIIVQAGPKSGALTTVDAALGLGRDVYVVPGPITSKLFKGSNQLLKDGAQIMLDPEDLLTDLNLQVDFTQSRYPVRWKELYEALESAMGASELSDILGLPLKVVYAALMELELDGWIRHVPGGLYERNLSG